MFTFRTRTTRLATVYGIFSVLVLVNIRLFGASIQFPDQPALSPNGEQLYFSWNGDIWNSEDPRLDQTKAALIGIARGDWFGTGLGGGIQKYGLLPERHTDMIFAVIGEELGILGMLFVILSFAYILTKGFNIAKLALKKGRKYSSYVVFGICTWFAMQITVNIGMNLELLPPKGFTLPLISYGGTSMIFTIISLAIILRVDMENKTNYSKQRKYV